MKFTTTSLALFSLAKLSLADSESFQIKINGGSLSTGMGVDGDDLIIDGNQAISGRITDAGEFLIGFQYVGVGQNNQMVLVDDESQATTGWGIKNGALTYSQSMYAVPGDSNTYKLYFGSAPNGNDVGFTLSTENSLLPNGVASDFSPSQSAPAGPTVSTSANGDSLPFSMLIIRSGSQLQAAEIAISNNNLVVNGQPGIQAEVTSEGLLKVGDQFVTTGPNFQLAVTSDITKATPGFSIQNGFVAGQSFFAVPNASGFDLYIGTTEDANNTPFAIKALGNEGSNSVPDFVPTGVPATVPTTQSSESSSSTSSDSTSLISSTELSTDATSTPVQTSEESVLRTSTEVSPTPVSSTAVSSDPVTFIQTTAESLETSKTVSSSIMSAITHNTTSSVSTLTSHANTTSAGPTVIHNTTTLSSVTQNTSTSATSSHPKNDATVRSVGLGAIIAGFAALLL